MLKYYIIFGNMTPVLSKTQSQVLHLKVTCLDVEFAVASEWTCQQFSNFRPFIIGLLTFQSQT